MEILALSSVQIHCSCKTIGNSIKDRDVEELNRISNFLNSGKLISPPFFFFALVGISVVFIMKFCHFSDTSFYPCKDDVGRTVFKTEPKILFCDMKLFPGESRSCKLY